MGRAGAMLGARSTACQVTIWKPVGNTLDVRRAMDNQSAGVVTALRPLGQGAGAPPRPTWSA